MIKKIRLLDIGDKIIISNKRFCPPHYFPHKLPFGEKIADEPCHIHKARWREFHHNIFCRILRCPNFDFMLAENIKRKK